MKNDRPAYPAGTSMRVRYQSRCANTRSWRDVFLSDGTGMPFQSGRSGRSLSGVATSRGVCSSWRATCQRPSRRTSARSPPFPPAGSRKSDLSASRSWSVRHSSPGLKRPFGWNGPL